MNKVSKTSFLIGACVALAACLGAMGAAFAQSGKKGIFTIHNDTASNVVVGFYTNDGDGWSKNWLSENVKPGDTAEMEFTQSGAKCQQTLRVGWLSKNGGEVKDDPTKINICKASNVYLKDNEILFD